MKGYFVKRIAALAILALTLIVLGVMCGASLNGARVVDLTDVEDTDLFHVKGTITPKTAKDLTLHIRAFLSAEDRSDEYYLVIDSEGGSLFAGIIMLNRLRELRANDVKVHCYVVDEAMSMAYWLLSECDQRFTTAYAQLLWHPAYRIESEGIDAPAMKAGAEELEMRQAFIKKRIQEEMKIDPILYEYYAVNQFIWIGVSLSERFPEFIKVIDAIKLPAATEAPVNPASLLMQQLFQMPGGKLK
jgi:ATP-dependent protease ClpP protease subunit